MDPATAFSKQRQLEDLLRSLGSVLVAFSGGVDSTYLLAVSRRVLGKAAVAATARSPIQCRHQLEAAERFTRRWGIEHHWIDTEEMTLDAFVSNPPERCYVCKRHLAAKLRSLADRLSLQHVAHGANRDDLGDYRPGMTAAREAGLQAPLLEVDLAKDEIRELSRRLELPTWDRPAMACLASRVPYGEEITPEKLRVIAGAEDFLRRHGMEGCRVRHHGAVARLEVPAGRLEALVKEPLRGNVVAELRRLGFSHVALDLEGYVTGSLNRVLG